MRINGIFLAGFLTFAITFVPTVQAGHAQNHQRRAQQQAQHHHQNQQKASAKKHLSSRARQQQSHNENLQKAAAAKKKSHPVRVEEEIPQVPVAPPTILPPNSPPQSPL